MPQLVLPANREIILKFKKNTPSSVIDNFMNGFPSMGNTSLARKIRDLNVSKSRMLFKDYQSYIYAFDNNDDEFGLSRIFVLEIDDSKMSMAIEIFSKEDHVEYIELNNSMKLENINITPNDPYFDQQYYLSLTSMMNAWNITPGDSNIIIGVIDSGLDFTHPDLQNSFKINYGEYGNGKEYNGIDDDGNGFIDDWRGWDFVHAPFTGDPRRGDYLDPDNDPTDDNRLSHGTAVSGLINAGFNNFTGIASVAPGCKILVMRAFDAEGYGEEDDVASAVLYGLMMGVRVFNFSFGDYIFSNLLRDVTRFAHFKNAVIITSAGNDGSNRLHYPSAYDEVISVGASDPSDQKAGFSSFGETVDIFAPGLQILTTTRVGRGNSVYNGDYDKYNGTSFAAPQVSGMAALLLSLNPSLSNEEVRGILVSSTSYMVNQSSWNHVNSSGRLNAVTALQNFDNPSIARIHYPFQDFTFEEESIPVCISAASPFLRSFTVMYGTGERPGIWNTIIPERYNQVLNDTAGYWNTSALPDSSYTLRLVINSSSGKTIEHRMIVFKDRNPPVITDVNFGKMIDKNNYSQVILFGTNKRTLGKVYYRKKNSPEPYQFVLADIGTPNIGYVTHGHLAIIPDNSLIQDTDYEFYLEAVSLNGRKVTNTSPEYVFRTGSEINSYGYVQKPYSLPYSQSARSIMDVTGNGNNDIFINSIKNNLKLNVYEFSAGVFNKVSSDNWGDFKVARDAADINGNGKLNLLVSKSRDGFLYEAPAPGNLPVNLIWSDSGNNNFWSSGFADTDSDGKMEFLGFTNTGLKIMEAEGEYNFVESAVLPYFGLNPQANSQNVLVEDFNNDGNNGVCFINLYYRNQTSTLPELAINVFKNVSDNNFTRIFTDTLRRFLKADNIVSGDFTGDGNKEIAIGTVSKDGDLVQYYSLYVYKSFGNSFSLIDIVDIFNYKTYTETSTRAGNIDNDNKDEILVNTGTHFYIFKYDEAQARFLPVFYKKDINTTNQIIFDFDGNGINEIGLNTINDTLLFFEKDISFAGPPTPLNFEGYSLDSNVVRLSFSPVAGAKIYRVYKADSASGFVLYDSVHTPEYFDENVLNRVSYRYRVSAVDYDNKIQESILSDEINVYVHSMSKLLTVEYEGQGSISVGFSEKIQYNIPNLNTFTVDGLGHPDNIAFKNDHEYFLLYNDLPAGKYNLSTKGLKDYYNSPVDSNAVSFNVEIHDSISFYLVSLNMTERLKLKIEFNLNVDSVSVLNRSNYLLEPFDIGVINVEIDGVNKKLIYLTLEDKAHIGATGKNYILKVKNIFSEEGIKIVEGAGSSFGMIFNMENLDNVYVYPNPYSIASLQNYVTFANLTRSATIRIYDLTGKFIREIIETDGNGGAEWDLKDDRGREVSTGIYFYNAEGVNSSGEKVSEKFGKFAIVR
jgi:subtilisin family serine protease